MKRWMFQGLLMLLTASAPAATLSDRIASYTIRAELDPPHKTVTGHESLTWRNTSPDPISELRLHLYLNAFRNEQSTFMRESRGGFRGDRMSPDVWGSTEIQHLRIAGGADLLSSLHFIHPDDDNSNDRTVVAVPLPHSLEPGQSAVLEIDFTDRLPRIFARTGYRNDFFMVGQWFPKIGVYEKTGDRHAARGAWNCHQYHADSEFFADFGVYDVTLNVPSAYLVGATGVLQSSADDPVRHRKTLRFHQDDVHDFAWTASPRFVRTERLFDPSHLISPAEVSAAAEQLGVSAAALKLQPVRIILLMQPEHAGQASRHYRSLENSLKWFGLWYGAYPYRTITLVDPPYGADRACCSEYPTLISGGTSWWPAPGGIDPEALIVHEFGHQYWYGMVATNEFEEAWLDEGFTTYSTGKLMDKVYGPRDLPLQFLGFPVAALAGLPKVSQDTFNRAAYLLYGKYDPIARNAWQFHSAFSYGVNSYSRPAVVLRTLENYLGAPVMARIMRAWFERNRFRHPDSLDFEQLVNQVSGRDLNWFFHQFVRGTNWLNYRVDSVSNLKGRAKNENRLSVTLMREGEAIFPVEVQLTYEDASVERRDWDGRDRWVRWEWTGPSRLSRVEIDQRHKVPLDGSFADNSWTADFDPLPLARWSSNLLCWLQVLLP